MESVTVESYDGTQAVEYPLRFYIGKRKIETVSSGDICALVGIEGFSIGDTIADIENP